MSKDIKILFVADVHGRDFWREPVMETLKENEDAKIIFLGDYVDPYPFDFEEEKEKDENFNFKKKAIDVLNEIIDLKYNYPDRIILLIGNHDAGYCISEDICSSRHDYLNGNIINEIFRENRNEFQLAYEENINGTNFLFSHAGISKQWIDYNFNTSKTVVTKKNIVDFLNNAWLVKNIFVLNKLGQYDNFRGLSIYKYGSPIWADIRAMYKLTPEELLDSYQIVGHTQLSTDFPLMSDKIGDFDCRKCFYINSEGKIIDYLTDKDAKETHPE